LEGTVSGRKKRVNDRRHTSSKGWIRFKIGVFVVKRVAGTRANGNQIGGET
jgi:hypothetical protein